mgnify:CR=1 FL=1
MTDTDFEKARKQLQALSMAVQYRESYMRQTLMFYKARQYVWAMHYQFLFLEWQDKVRELGEATLNTDAHKLWYLIGGRP